LISYRFVRLGIECGYGACSGLAPKWGQGSGHTHSPTLSRGDKISKRTNVILKGVRVTTVAVEEQHVLSILSVCVCFFVDLACNTHVPYCIVICGLPRSTTFFQIISQTPRFSEKSNQTQNVCFDFLYNFLSEPVLIVRRTERDVGINVCEFSRKANAVPVRSE